MLGLVVGARNDAGRAVVTRVSSSMKSVLTLPFFQLLGAESQAPNFRQYRHS